MKQNDGYNVLTICPATLVHADIKGFENFFRDEGFSVQYEGEFKTLPDTDNGNPIPETGGRNDVLFYVHDDSIGKFAIWRLSYGIRWWDDYLASDYDIVPKEILEKYPA